MRGDLNATNLHIYNFKIDSVWLVGAFLLSDRRSLKAHSNLLLRSSYSSDSYSRAIGRLDLEGFHHAGGNSINLTVRLTL